MFIRSYFRATFKRFVDYSDKLKNLNLLKCDSKVLVLVLGVGSVLVLTYALDRYSPKDVLTKLENSNFKKPEVHRDVNIARTGHLICVYGTWLPEYMFPNLKLLDDIKRFQMKRDDVLVVSFPKSGTTWVQEIVTQILALHSTISTNRQHSNIEDRFPYIEYPYPGLKSLRDQPSPRLLKSHLPYWFMPQSVFNNIGKVIYIARQPKDVCVSYYNFVKMISFLHYNGSFQDFFQNFLNGTVAYGPWIDHVISFWEHRNDPNILFITYEDLHMNSPKVIKRIAEFLGVVLSDQQIDEIAKETKFEKMKDNPSVNYSWWDDLGIRNKKESNFMRKGVIGDHRNYMTDDMIKQMDDKMVMPDSVCDDVE